MRDLVGARVEAMLFLYCTVRYSIVLYGFIRFLRRMSTLSFAPQPERNLPGAAQMCSGRVQAAQGWSVSDSSVGKLLPPISLERRFFDVHGRRRTSRASGPSRAVTFAPHRACEPPAARWSTATLVKGPVSRRLWRASCCCCSERTWRSRSIRPLCGVSRGLGLGSVFRV